MNVFSILFVSCSIMVMMNNAIADCTPANFQEGAIWLYEGNIDKYSIRMVLSVQSNGSVEGRYIYHSSANDIKLIGLQKNNTLKLIEKDNHNQDAAIFDGFFQKEHGNACGNLIGSWKDLRSGKTLSFNLSGGYIFWGGTIGPKYGDHIYGQAGVENDELINEAAINFQKAVKNNDKYAVAKMIAYPLDLMFFDRKQWPNKPKKRITITLHNEHDFIKYYDIFFDVEKRKRISDDFSRLLTTMYEGVATPSGCCMFRAKDGKIFSLEPVKMTSESVIKHLKFNE